MPPGMRLVICGTAAGTESARTGHYYTKPSNRFWRVLLQTGLIDEPLTPRQDRRLPEFGIGLTDVCKTQHGMDHQLGPDAFDAPRLWAAVAHADPGALAFNGLASPRAALGLGSSARLPFGPLEASDMGRPIWVLPSTSGAAGATWDPEVWAALARALPAPAQ
jgi:TDG/mug DNA glycosylase family protein